jgi:hypothetical protein
VIQDDTVRKLFKDTDHQAICSWYRTELQQWFKSKRVFHPAELFILDQSHLVVLDNTNYHDAVKMPVDEHGQLYKHLSTLSDAEKKALVYHRSYALSALLHTDPLGERYLIAGYRLGASRKYCFSIFPNRSLVESHVCFTLFTYSLLQLYLNRKNLQTHTKRMFQTLRAEEQVGLMRCWFTAVNTTVLLFWTTTQRESPGSVTHHDRN